MNLDIIGISTALAETAPAPQQGIGGTILMLVGFVLIFYFFLIRPQSKRAKEQRDLLSKLAVEDEVLTTSGIAGKITQVGTAYVKLQIAKGVDITIQKIAITSMLPKGTIGEGSLLEIKKVDEETKEVKKDSEEK